MFDSFLDDPREYAALEALWAQHASPLIAIWMREEPTERAKSLNDVVWTAQTTALQATAGLG
jgi:hypothetical protein